MKTTVGDIVINWKNDGIKSVLREGRTAVKTIDNIDAIVKTLKKDQDNLTASQIRGAKALLETLRGTKAASRALEKQASATKKVRRETDKATQATRKQAKHQKELTRATKASTIQSSKFARILKMVAASYISYNLISKALRSISDSFRYLVSAGLQFNETIEASQLGIASMISATSKLVNQQGKEYKGVTKIYAAQKLAAGQMEKLRIAGLATVATTEQLVEGFQQAVGPLSKAGLSLDQMRIMSVQIVQAAGALGMPMYQIAEEVRSIASGFITAHSRVAKTLGITGKMVKEWKSMGTLFQEVNKRMQAFTDAAALAFETWRGIKSNIEESSQYFSGEVTKGLFDSLKTSALSVLDSVYEIQKNTRGEFTKFEISPRFAESQANIKKGFDEMGKSVEEAFTPTTLQTFLELLASVVSGASVLTKGLAAIVTHMNTLAAIVTGGVITYGFRRIGKRAAKAAAEGGRIAGAVSKISPYLIAASLAYTALQAGAAYYKDEVMKGLGALDLQLQKIKQLGAEMAKARYLGEEGDGLKNQLKMLKMVNEYTTEIKTNIGALFGPAGAMGTLTEIKSRFLGGDGILDIRSKKLVGVIDKIIKMRQLIASGVIPRIFAPGLEKTLDSATTKIYRFADGIQKLGEFRPSDKNILMVLKAVDRLKVQAEAAKTSIDNVFVAPKDLSMEGMINSVSAVLKKERMKQAKSAEATLELMKAAQKAIQENRLPQLESQAKEIQAIIDKLQKKITDKHKKETEKRLKITQDANKMFFDMTETAEQKLLREAKERIKKYEAYEKKGVTNEAKIIKYRKAAWAQYEKDLTKLHKKEGAKQVETTKKYNALMVELSGDANKKLLYQTQERIREWQKLMEQRLITEEDFLALRAALWEKYNKDVAKTGKNSLGKLLADWSDWGKHSEEITTEALKNIQGEFAKTFGGIITGEIDDLGDAFKRLSKNILNIFSQMLAQLATKWMVSNLAKMLTGSPNVVTGAGGGGMGRDLLNSLLSSRSSAGPSWTGNESYWDIGGSGSMFGPGGGWTGNESYWDIGGAAAGGEAGAGGGAGTGMGAGAGAGAALAALAIAYNGYQSHDAGAGAMSGAMSGAMAGTMILPGWGTLIGGLAGAAIGFMSGSAGEDAIDKAAGEATKKFNDMFQKWEKGLLDGTFGEFMQMAEAMQLSNNMIPMDQFNEWRKKLWGQGRAKWYTPTAENAGYQFGEDYSPIKEDGKPGAWKTSESFWKDKSFRWTTAELFGNDNDRANKWIAKLMEHRGIRDPGKGVEGQTGADGGANMVDVFAKQMEGMFDELGPAMNDLFYFMQDHIEGSPWANVGKKVMQSFLEGMEDVDATGLREVQGQMARFIALGDQALKTFGRQGGGLINRLFAGEQSPEALRGMMRNLEDILEAFGKVSGTPFGQAIGDALKDAFDKIGDADGLSDLAKEMRSVAESISQSYARMNAGLRDFGLNFNDVLDQFGLNFQDTMGWSLDEWGDFLQDWIDSMDNIQYFLDAVDKGFNKDVSRGMDFKKATERAFNRLMDIANGWNAMSKSEQDKVWDYLEKYGGNLEKYKADLAEYNRLGDIIKDYFSGGNKGGWTQEQIREFLSQRSDLAGDLGKESPQEAIKKAVEQMKEDMTKFMAFIDKLKDLPGNNKKATTSAQETADATKTMVSILKNLDKNIAWIAPELRAWKASRDAETAHAGGVIMHAGGVVAQAMKANLITSQGGRRFHSGGLAYDEVPAIVQRGEIVLSKQDVAHLGGPQQAEQLRKSGRLGATVNVQVGDVYLSGATNQEDVAEFVDLVSREIGERLANNESLNGGII